MRREKRPMKLKSDVKEEGRKKGMRSQLCSEKEQKEEK
jgi:hypothetical protein